MNKVLLLALFAFFTTSLSFAKDVSCYDVGVNCGSSSKSSSNPSSGNQIRINPSAVPTQRGYGLEGIYYDSETDFSIVRGLGRIGAAISPSNSDETFFGAPGFEISQNLLARKANKKKYPNQKVNLATAMVLAEKNSTVLKSYALKLGVMGKYNQLNKHVNFGGGLSGLLGPVTFGYSNYLDESQLDYSLLGSDQKQDVKYRVQAYSLGLSLESFLLDFSNLRYVDPLYNYEDESSVKIVTLSFNYKKFIFTISNRLEESYRPMYDFDTKVLITRQRKNENFGAIQYIASKYITVGVLYNYYLLREFSATATVFF
jgi:hypothetical protein